MSRLVAVTERQDQAGKLHIEIYHEVLLNGGKKAAPPPPCYIKKSVEDEARESVIFRDLNFS